VVVTFLVVVVIVFIVITGLISRLRLCIVHDRVASEVEILIDGLDSDQWKRATVSSDAVIGKLQRNVTITYS